MAMAPLTRSGTSLQVNGATKRFSGANAYWVGLDDNNGGTPGSFPTHNQITNAFNGMKAMGTGLARVHTVGISTGTSMSYETAAGVFSDANLDSADWAVYQAGIQGIYLMVPLTDQWNYYHGGLWNFIHWAYQQNSSGITDVNGSVKGDSNQSQFFANTAAGLRIRALFKAYISAWMNHVNPYTGLAYKDDPTIAIIETGNEIYSATSEWTQDIASYIKSIAPNKLVADGSAAGGLVVASAPGLNAASVDILGGHYYAQNGDPNWEQIGFTSKPSRYGSNVSFIDQMNADAAAATAAGKAFIVGEYPWTRSDVAAYYTAAEKNPNIDGDMYWAFVANTDAGAPEVHGGAFGSDDYPVHYPYSGTQEQTNAPALVSHMAAMSSTLGSVTVGSSSTNLISSPAMQHMSDASQWTAQPNGTLATDTSVSQEGGSSMRWSPVASVYPYIYPNVSTTTAPVTPGSQYTGFVSIYNTTRGDAMWHVVMLWYNSSGSVITTTNGSGISTPTNTWTKVSVTGTAPAGAVYAGIQIQADVQFNAGNNMWFDELGVNPGTSTVWTASDTPVATTGTATLSGVGSLAATGVATTIQVAAGTATLSGSGALTTTRKPAFSRAAALAGSGALTASFTSAVQASGTATLSGAGALSVTVKPGYSASAAFSGAGALTAGTLAGTSANAALAGNGALTATGVAVTGASAVAALTGSGALSATRGPVGVSKAVALSGAGALTASVRASAVAAASLAGSGSLTTTGNATVAYAGTAALSGSGALTSTFTRGFSGVAALTGSGSLAATGHFVEAPTPPPVSMPLPGVPARVNARNITGYSVQEDATPLDISSTEGGVGSISFAIPADNNSIMLFDADIELDDDFRGTTSGTVTHISVSGGINSVVADNQLGVLVGTTTAKPISGTFEAVARYYLSLGAIYDNIYVDPAIASIEVSAQGWQDDAWLKLKQLAAANGAEISLVSNQIVFRPVRTLTTDIRHRTDFSVDLEKSDIARAVEVTYYDNIWVDGDVIYPRTSEEQGSAQVYQVEAGQILEDDITLTASVESVLQPVCVDDVAQDYDGTQSVYSVRAVDNSQVTPQDWAAGGGKIELTIGEDTKTLHIKITGSSDQYFGPYRIAGRMKEVDNANTTIIPPGSTDNPATAPAKEAAKPASTKTTTTTSSVTYPASKNDYPWPNAPVNGLSPLRYSYRDCVDFVAWRINRDSGHTKAPWKWTWANLRKTNGNAIGWKHDWELHGWATGITPVPGCIAWFGTSAGAYGHVAYVQSVDTVNKTVHLEEYNWGAKQAYHTRTIKWSSVGSFLASPAGSTKTIIQNTTVKDAKAAVVSAAVTADAEANKAFTNPAESETDYASLRIVGTGVLIDPQVLTLPTGAALSRTATDVGVTVTNPYVSTLEDAYTTGVYVASRYKGESHSISGSITVMQQSGEGPGHVIYRRIEEFNRVYDGKTIADFNAEWSGKTIGDFNAAQKTDIVGTFFDSQVFGNVAGARFQRDNAMWRITSTTITESKIDFTAVRDTMIEDFNEAHAGKTIADFNAQYAGMTMKQFGRIPLLGG